MAANVMSNGEMTALVLEGMDSMWLILTAAGILLTQVGFASLEAGAARRKDEKTVLFKNLLDHSIASVCWYFIGWRIFTSFGHLTGKSGDVVLTYARILQQFGFEITTSSILSACVLGRCRLDTYLLFSAFLASFSYPILAFICWNPHAPLAMYGYKDFGGGGVVHFFGGLSGLIASRLCGKRVQGNAGSGGPPALTAIGGLVLYISWFFVNAGSSGSVTSENAIRSAQRAALNTGLSAGASSISAFLICRFVKKRLNLDFLVNSLIGGLISITAPSGYVNPPAAILIGLAAPWVVLKSSNFVVKVLDVDDPMDAVSVHGACGLFGVIATGIFHHSDGLVATGSLGAVVVQVVGAILIVCWTLCTSLPFFSIAKYMGALAYTDSEQMAGLDNVYFGEYAHKGANDTKVQTTSGIVTLSSESADDPRNQQV